MTSVTAWYIRHGRNPANQSRQLSHKIIDYPLTDCGIAQATTLAERLASEPAPAAIYASPLRRAAQTAGIIAARTGSEVADRAARKTAKARWHLEHRRSKATKAWTGA